MKAYKSQLAKDILNSDIRIPLHNGATFRFQGKTYVVKKVPTKKL